MNAQTIKAGMLGLAVGDALGVPAEFKSRQELDREPVQGMRSGGTHSQPAGTWSDDTSMALCLLESLTGGLNYHDMMTRFLRWAEDGYLTAHGETFDMGMATRKALVKFAQGPPPLACGGKQEFDNGNGSLMRILPLALYLQAKIGPSFSDKPEAYEIIHSASALTHAHPVSLICCGIYCAAADAIIGDGGIPALHDAVEQAKGFYRASALAPWLEEFQQTDVGTLLAAPREMVKSGGYAVHTLEAALWCLLHTETYRDCALAAVNLGDDTDTTAAVAGGLAGLRYGLESIPAPWLEVLAKRDQIEAMCQAFAQSLSAGA